MSTDERLDKLEQLLRVLEGPGRKPNHSRWHFPKAATIVVAALLLALAPLQAQAERPVLPQDQIKVRHLVDSAAELRAHRLEPIRLAGSRLGSADVLLHLLRIDEFTGITKYRVIITVTDTTYFGPQWGASLQLSVDQKRTVVLELGNLSVVYPGRDDTPRPPPLPGERRHFTEQEVAWYQVKAMDLVTLADAPRIEVILIGRRGRLTRYLEGSGLDQFRGFIAYYVEPTDPIRLQPK